MHGKFQMLEPYLDSNDLEDPLTGVILKSEARRQKRLKLVAASIRYYSHDKPELRNLIQFDDEKHFWRKVSMFRTCVFKNKQVIQAEDIVFTSLSSDKQKMGVVKYFTREMMTIKIHLFRCVYPADLPDDWQLFVSDKKSIIQTDEELSVQLGDMESFQDKHSIKLNSVRIINNSLHQTNLRSVLPDYANHLVESYLLVHDDFLHLHRLVVLCAKFVSLKMEATMLQQIILNDFEPYRSYIENEDINHTLSEFDLCPMNRDEEKCCCCLQTRKMSAVHDSTCDVCFVSLRQILGIFNILEKHRKYTQNTRSLRKIMPESQLFSMIAGILTRSNVK